MIIYKGLFPYREKFNASTAIAYSTLVSHSLWENGIVFDGNGDFDIDAAKDYLDVCKDNDGFSYIDVPYFTCSTLSHTLQMSERNVKYVLKNLRKNNILKSDCIFVPSWLIESGYVKIAENTTMKGWQLVLYSLLKERSEYFGGKIDTWTYKIAEMFSTTENNVNVLLSILKKKGYIFKTKKGEIYVK